MKKIILPALVTAFVAAIVFGTLEVTTLVILTITGFIAAMAILLLFCRIAPVSGWPLWKQRTVIWGIAAGTAAIACFMLFATQLMKREGLPVQFVVPNGYHGIFSVTLNRTNGAVVPVTN